MVLSVSGLPSELRDLIESGPMTHLSTINPDGSPQVNPYAALRARATIEPTEQAWDLLNRLTKVYTSPDAEFPAPRGPGYIVRYSIERIGGVGP